MHRAGVQELSHGGVDEGEACAAGAPGVEVGWVVFPGYVGVFGFEGFVHTEGRAPPGGGGWLDEREVGGGWSGGEGKGREGKRDERTYHTYGQWTRTCL